MEEKVSTDATETNPEHEAIAALNLAFQKEGIKAVAEHCKIIGPLRKYGVRLDGSNIAKLERAERELMLSMRSMSAPLILTNSKSGLVEMDFMFDTHPIVRFDDMVRMAREEQKAGLRKPGYLDLCLGATEINKPLIRDLDPMPHLLIAGTTGSGKSMTEHAIIKSLTEGVLTKPDVKLYLMDPKMVEFSRYDGLPQLAYDIGHSVSECVDILRDIEDRMRTRLEKLEEKGCRDIKEYRAEGHRMSDIVLLIDEMADLMRDKKSGFEQLLCTIAAMGRAAGIHIVIATQHPSHQVVTGLIKANFSSRIGCKVTSHIHSKVVLDQSGAENLAGKGDALICDNELDMQRYMGCFVEPMQATQTVRPQQKSFLQRLLKR